MPKRKPYLPPDIVPHPRYGSRIRPGFRGVSEAQLRNSFRGYLDATIFPESTIRANTSEQNGGVMTVRPYYVDILKKCQTCERHFIFFAMEQQFWYETLKFYIDADCNDCCECRKTQQADRRRFKQYSELAAEANLTNDQLTTFVEISLELWNDGTLTNAQPLRRLKNLAMKRLPDHPLTAAIEKFANELPASAG